MHVRQTDRPREKHGDETYWRESEKNVNERREKQRDTDKTARDERTDRMGETGKGTVHPAHTSCPAPPAWGQDSKGPVCRELPVLRVRQTPNK